MNIRKIMSVVLSASMIVGSYATFAFAEDIENTDDMTAIEETAPEDEPQTVSEPGSDDTGSAESGAEEPDEGLQAPGQEETAASAEIPSYSAPAAKQEDANDYMSFRTEYSYLDNKYYRGFSIDGFKDNGEKWYFASDPWLVRMIVDNRDPVDVCGPDNTHFFGTDTTSGSITTSVTAEVADSSVILTYSVTNTGNRAHNVRLGTCSSSFSESGSADNNIVEIDYANNTFVATGSHDPLKLTLTSDTAFSTYFLGPYTRYIPEQGTYEYFWAYKNMFNQSSVSSINPDHVKNCSYPSLAYSWNFRVAARATVTRTVTFTLQHSQTVTAEDMQVEYGESNIVADASVTGPDTGDLSYEVTSGSDVISIDASTGAITTLKAGTAQIKVTASETPGCAAASDTATISVLPRKITVTAENKSKDWGSDDPELTFNVSGFVNYEHPITGAPARAAGEDPGTYEITQGTIALTSGNYTIETFTPATFTINEVYVPVTIDYCDGTEPVTNEFAASIPLQVYLERQADKREYEGRVITGWYLDADYTQSYDYSKPLGLDGAVIYAKWGEVEYSFIEGAGATWTKDSTEGLTFRVSRNVGDQYTFSHFAGIDIDGQEADKNAYDATNGSVIITLKVDLLKTLSIGDHKITVHFDDGHTAEASFSVRDKAKPSPKTGEEASPMCLVAAGMLLAAGAAFLVDSKKNAKAGR